VIPVVDLERSTVIADFRAALEDVGFMILVGHGVSPALIERTFAEAKRFHDQPADVKMSLRMNEHNNGYMAMGRYAVWTSEVNANDKPDLNEAFFVRRERRPDDPLVRAGRRFAGPNVWPDALPGFRDNVLAYVAAMDALSARVLPVCAEALDLPRDHFDAAFADSQFTFRLSHYPPVIAEPNQFGIAPHTDANFLTFLAQTDVPGLQVRMPSGAWEDIPYVPGSFAVNSGDMMVRWTNGRFKSTPHRAVPPVGRDRYAIPFFLGPHMDTVIDCLPTCAGAGARLPPITYEAYLKWWYDANYPPALQRASA
jgi:isopenicillin N synthase-like dioxygenase